MNFNDAMNEVLKGSRYDYLTGRRADPREELWRIFERILRWLADRLDFDMPNVSQGSADMIVVIFTVIAILLVIVASYIIIRAYLRSRVAVRHTLSDIFEEIRNHTVAELLEISRNSGDVRVSVRYKYIATILSLNERDIIVIQPSATNAIIYRQIKKSAPHLAMPFSQIADAFHLAWFGHKSLSDDALQRFNSAAERVIFGA
ncbi:MAG: DUF4129 domain-containing protein [Clostridiales bacterium]|jgi:hypothetical protein|nr:DUF4129 domain-containing protein [Clostridiales bacterium]